MSGGSLNYISYSLYDVVDKVPDPEVRMLTKDFSELLHELEWYLSGDTSEGDWLEALEHFRVKWLMGKRDERLIQIFEEKQKSMKKEFEEMLGLGKYCKDCSHFSREDTPNYGVCELHHGCLDHYHDPACENFVEVV